MWVEQQLLRLAYLIVGPLHLICGCDATVICLDTVVNGTNVEVIEVVSASVSASVLDVQDPLVSSADNQTDNRLSELIVDAASEKSDSAVCLAVESVDFSEFFGDIMIRYDKLV